MTITQPDHPTDYRMVKLVDGKLLVGTISVDESFLRIENPLQLTTVQRMTEFGMKDDSSLAPWIPLRCKGHLPHIDPVLLCPSSMAQLLPPRTL